MFGGGKKPERPKRDHTGRNLAQYGLFDVSANVGGQDSGGADYDNDSDFEAELAALTEGTSAKPRRKPAKPAPVRNLDGLVNNCMKDIPSDEELSGDDNDPDLLNELSEITGSGEERPQAPVAPHSGPIESTDTISVLNSRLKSYEEAEKIAKSSGESSRARRFNRAIKTIKDLIRKANAGATINPDDIPPEVSTGPRKPSPEDSEPTRPAPPVPSEPDPIPEPTKSEEPPSVDPQLIYMLNERKTLYKTAALAAKKSGDNATALSYIKTAKQFEAVISAAEGGQAVDLTRMPGPPPAAPQVENNQMQTDSVPEIPIPEEEAPERTLIEASSVAEALEQRIAVYRKQEEKATQEGNASKARRNGRIVKQYEQAIKANKAGKPIPVDELPTPPGYAPIPVEGAQAPKAAPVPESKLPQQPPTPPKNKPSTSQPQTTRITGNQEPNSRAEKQMVFLLAKQKEFKEAALKAKRDGEIEQAKELLRTAKGFEPLIQAASCGLPVDLSTLPISPSAKSHLDDYYLVNKDECTDSDSTNADMITRLEVQLTQQLKMSLSTRDHHKALGDVAGMNRFERLALNVTKDLDIVRLAQRTPGAGIPKFHYETKDFSIVKSFTELGENDLELTILQGISYTCSNPKDIDTYVKFEFPFPQEEPYGDRSSTVKDTNNPAYNATFTIPIQRTSRPCQRVFKRHALKLEVYSKGGFFRGDTLLGTATVKLQPLETQCELHESYDLMDGRRKAGGKLELRLRLRHPIVAQQVEQIHEKWLVIDN